MRKIFFVIAICILSACTHSNVKNELKLTPVQSGYLPVNGIEMYYEVYGAGKPLVLMHGGGSDIHVSFGKGIPALAKNYKVIAFDEQNHGKTRYYSRPFGFENTADDIAAALKQLGVNKAYFLGFSNGATTGMHLSIRHPDLIEKMVLGSGLYQKNGAPQQFWEFMKKGTIEHMPQELKDAYVNTAPEPKNLQKMHDGDAHRMRNFKDIPTREISKIKIPVLIMQNDQDVATVEHAVQTMRLLPKGRLTILAGPHDNFLSNIGSKKPAMTQASENIIIDFFKSSE
jgi:pimeloyl-ACP methyl ester carboxylesterase